MKVKLGDSFVRKHSPNYHQGPLMVETILGKSAVCRFPNGKRCTIELSQLEDERKYTKVKP